MSKKNRQRNFDRMIEEDENFFSDSDVKYRQKRKTRRSTKHKLDDFAKSDWYTEEDLDELDMLEYEECY